MTAVDRLIIYQVSARDSDTVDDEIIMVIGVEGVGKKEPVRNQKYQIIILAQFLASL